MRLLSNLKQEFPVHWAGWESYGLSTVRGILFNLKYEPVPTPFESE